jgi:hypothetical protein
LLFGGRGDHFRALLGLRRGLFALDRIFRDLVRALENLGHGPADAVELDGDHLALVDPVARRLGRSVDPLGDDLHVGLDLADQVLDVAGAPFRGLGERAHLVGDDREALAVLAGARRLDGGVQREQIGLVGDAADGADDVADARRLPLEFEQHRDRRGLPIGGGADAGDAGADLPGEIADEQARGVGLVMRGFRDGLGLAHGAGDAGDRAAGHLGSARRLLRAGGDQLHGLAELFGGRS